MFAVAQSTLTLRRGVVSWCRNLILFYLGREKTKPITRETELPSYMIGPQRWHQMHNLAILPSESVDQKSYSRQDLPGKKQNCHTACCLVSLFIHRQQMGCQLSLPHPACRIGHYLRLIAHVILKPQSSTTRTFLDRQPHQQCKGSKTYTHKTQTNGFAAHRRR